jgi:hypothetical protein
MPTTVDRAPYAVLLPEKGWEMAPQLFERETERNEAFDTPMPWPGHAEQITYKVPEVGILSKLRFIVTGTVTTVRATGTIVTTDAWPHGLFSRISLRLNGQNQPWGVRGQDLQVLRQARVRNVPETFVTSNVTATGVGATDPLRISYEIPLAIDPAVAPNLGGLFAQSAHNEITVEMTAGAKSDLVTLTGDGTFTVNPTTLVQPVRTWFSIPDGKLPSGDGATGMILPDLTTLHGFTMQEVGINQVGELVMELNRIQGVIARVFVRLKNGPLSINPVTGVDEWQFRYATNQRPRVMKPYALGWENEERYRGALPYSATSPMDAISENLSRDLVNVENLSNPVVAAVVNSGVALVQPAKAFVTFEFLAPLR